MNNKLKRVLSLIIVFVIMAANLTGIVSVFAADNVVREKVFVDFEKETKFSDFVSDDSNYKFSSVDPISGSQSLDVFECDFSWNNLSMNAFNMSVEFKFNCSPDFAGKFDLYLSTNGTSNNSQHVFSIIHQNNVLSLVDSTGKTIHTFSYNTVYKIKAELQRGKDTYSVYVNDARLDSDPLLTNKIFSVEAVRVLMNQSGSNSYVTIDDFNIFTSSKMYPQKYSSQKPGKLDTPKIDYKDENKISLFINDTKIYFADELFSEGNTVYVPAERLFDSVGMKYSENSNSVTVINEKLNLVFSAESNISTLNGKNIVLNQTPVIKNGIMYIPLNLINEALNADVWWDEEANLVVVTTGTSKTDNILKNIGGKFYMNGKPYYEISFLYESLFREIWASYKRNPEGIYNSPEYKNADEVLSDMEALGFNSIRSYFWNDNNYSVLKSSTDREIFFNASDIVFSLCEKHNIRIIPCLGLNSSMYIASDYIEGYGWATVNETVVDLISDPNSQSRIYMYDFLDGFIGRYKNNKTILMWELCNGANLSADCGSTNGDVAYSLLQLSEFYKDCTERVKEIDDSHLISSGDGLLRTAQWHLLSATMNGENEDWNYDNGTERQYALSLLSECFDVISVHGFNVGVATNAESFYTDENNVKVPLTFQYLKKEAKSLGKILYNGATNGIIDFNNSNVIEGQIKYLESIVESGVQLSHWQLNNGEELNATFFDRNSLSKAISDANIVLTQRYVINKAGKDNTNQTWDDPEMDIFNSDKINPGSTTAFDTVFFIGILKIISAVTISVLFIILIIFMMQKRSNKKNG